MRVRTSGGIRLIGASLFFSDRTRRRNSKASRSRIPIYETRHESVTIHAISSFVGPTSAPSRAVLKTRFQRSVVTYLIVQGVPCVKGYIL